MRTLSAAKIKSATPQRWAKRNGNSGGGEGQTYPGKDTHLGRMLDLLGAQRGYPIRLQRDEYGHNVAFSQLADLWGMDIRHGPWTATWVLVGEWFGSRYTSYLGGVTVEDCEPPSDLAVRQFCLENADSGGEP